MIRLIAIAGFALTVATGAQAMRPRRFISRTVLPYKSPSDAEWVGHELVVCAWQGPPNAKSAEPPAGVLYGTEAFALGTTDRPTLRSPFGPQPRSGAMLS